MAGAFIVSPYVYLADENGAPLSGGLVYSYAAGSGTPQPLYSDSALTVPYPPPIQLDSAGRFSGYALPVSYKIVVTKADGSAWWTQDNYWLATPAGAGLPATVVSTATNYAASSGAADQIILVDATAGPVTVSLYTAFGNTGFRVRVVKVDSSTNAVTVDPSGAQTINGATTAVLSAQWNTVGVVSDGANWVGLNSLRFPQVLVKAVDYTVAVIDGDDVMIPTSASGAARTITLYTAVGNKGRRVTVKKTDTSANTVTIDGNASETIDGALTFVLTVPNDVVVLESDGANWQIESARYGGSFASQSTTLTGTQHDFAVTAARHLTLRCNNASLLTITGFTPGLDGDIIEVFAINAQVDLVHQSGSTAADRLINFATSANSSLSLGTARYVYDATTARWRMMAHEQGAWITPTFVAGDYTTAGAGGITVQAGDVTTCAYRLDGRTLHVEILIETATLTAATGNSVSRTIPGGFSLVTTFKRFPAYVNNSATGLEIDYVQLLTTEIRWQRTAGGAFTAGANTFDFAAMFSTDVT